MVLNYTSVDRMLTVESMLGSVTSITTGTLSTFAHDAEADVNGYLAARYVVPVTGSPPLLVSIATDLALYRTLSRRVFTQERLKASTWPQTFKEALETLKEIAKGDVLLTDATGAVIAERSDLDLPWSDKKDYLPTFHEGREGTHTVDSEKIDDELEERGTLVNGVLT